MATGDYWSQATQAVLLRLLAMNRKRLGLPEHDHGDLPF
jgi:hypothetical protein